MATPDKPRRPARLGAAVSSMLSLPPMNEPPDSTEAPTGAAAEPAETDMRRAVPEPRAIRNEEARELYDDAPRDGARALGTEPAAESHATPAPAGPITTIVPPAHPRRPEPVAAGRLERVTVILGPADLDRLDTVRDAIEDSTGERPSRSDLIRSLIHGVCHGLDAEFTDALAGCATARQRERLIAGKLRGR